MYNLLSEDITASQSNMHSETIHLREDRSCAASVAASRRFAFFGEVGWWWWAGGRGNGVHPLNRYQCKVYVDVMLLFTVKIFSQF